MNVVAVILAAGKGTRMKSGLPKVLHPICGRSLLIHVMKAVAGTGSGRFIPILGHGREAVENELNHYSKKENWQIDVVEQKEQRGTGHALQMAVKQLQKLTPKQLVLILNGDGPLLRPESLLAMARTHSSRKNQLTIGVMDLEQPFGYGRVLSSRGRVLKIVEEKDATPAQKKIRHVNGGVYLCSADLLLQCLQELKPSQVTKEIYLTDIVAIANKRKARVGEHDFAAEELLGVNDHWQLAQVEKIIRQRINMQWMLDGVRMQDPDSTYIEADVRLSPEVTLEPGVVLKGETIIESGAQIKAYSHIEGAQIAAGAQVGPFARIRAGTKIGAKSKIGNFVELKKAVLMDDVKISHLSYVGDAEVGSEVNIGCGFITCNYDGVQKHQTKIANGAFIGSDVQAIAPISIGKDSYVASGTTLTHSVPDGALAISRTKQENKIGYAEKIRSRLQTRKK